MKKTTTQYLKDVYWLLVVIIFVCTLGFVMLNVIHSLIFAFVYFLKHLFGKTLMWEMTLYSSIFIIFNIYGPIIKREILKLLKRNSNT